MGDATVARSVATVVIGAGLAGAALVGSGCTSSGLPVEVEPGTPAFELVQTGGVAGILESQQVLPDGRVIRGPCPGGGDCGWEAGELLGSLPPGSVAEILDELWDAGYFREADRTYPPLCCDYIVVAFTARTRAASRTVTGVLDQFPSRVAEPVKELLRLVADATSEAAGAGT